MSSLETGRETQLVLVVAYDGSEPAQRALLGAAEMLRDRDGRMEVVYVAHVPSTVSFSAQAVVAVQEGMDTEEQELTARVDETLAGTGLKWHFNGATVRSHPSSWRRARSNSRPKARARTSCSSSAVPPTKLTATSTRHQPGSSVTTDSRSWLSHRDPS